MAEPKRILWAPFDAYVAAVGATFPDIDDTPDPNDWFLLGQNGARNYDDDGVTWTISDTKEVFRGAAETAIQKASRTEEDATVAFKLVDLAVEQFAKIIDDATVNTVAQAPGVAGNKNMSLYRGTEVATFALLLRGVGASPELLGGNAQAEFAQVFNEGDPAPALSKGGPAMLECEFKAMRDASGNYVEFVAQTTVAGS